MVGWLRLPDRAYHIPAYLDPDPDLTWSWDHFLHDKTGNYHDKP